MHVHAHYDDKKIILQNIFIYTKFHWSSHNAINILGPIEYRFRKTAAQQFQYFCKGKDNIFGKIGPE